MADDEILVRQGLCGLLSLEPDFEIVGQAGNGAEASELARKLTPDVVLMDIQMPVMNGVEATREILANLAGTRVLVLTTFSEDALVVQAMQAGAQGYLLKDSGARQIAAAIRSTAQGYMTINPAVTEKLLRQPRHSSEADLSMFTNREREVLQYLSKGSTNSEIAVGMGISEKTVRDHVSNILNRLNLRDRTQAALWAQEHL